MLVTTGAAALTLVFIVALMIVFRWHSDRHRSLEFALRRRAFNEALAAASQELSGIESDLRLISEVAPTLTGVSRERYLTESKAWAHWLALKQAAESACGRADAQREVHRSRLLFWIVSQKPLKAALQQLNSDQLALDSSKLTESGFAWLAASLAPASVRAEAAPQGLANGIARSVKSFAQAIRSASVAAEKVRQTLEGNQDPNESLVGLAQRLQDDCRLPPEPYQPALSTLPGEAAALREKLSTDPLTYTAGQEQTLVEQLRKLRETLATAIELHQATTVASERLAAALKRVSTLRSTPVDWKAGVVAPEQPYLLNEEGANPDLPLEEGKEALDRALGQLRRGELDACRQSYERAAARTSAAGLLADRALQDKEYVEHELAAIAGGCTATDLEVDAPARGLVLTEYGQQRWSAARSEVNALKAVHLERVACREELVSLSYTLRSVRRELNKHRDVVATSLDDEHASLLERSRQLRLESNQGRGDWSVLRKRTAELSELAAGDEPTSLSRRIKEAVAAHRAAIAAVASLRDTRQSVEAGVSDGWGGQEAAEKLAGLRGTVEEIVARSVEPRLDWSMLKARADQILEELSLARRLIDEEMHRRQWCENELVVLEEQLQAVKCFDYTHCVLAGVYGEGLSCPTTSVERLLPQARETFKGRKWVDCERLLQAARSGLHRAHLETYWLCLQMMSVSEDPTARAFAHQEGYMDGGLEAWIDRADEITDGNLFRLPQGPQPKKKTTPKPAGCAPIWADQPDLRDYQKIA